ncbi:hypothetical protein GCM10027174_36180 [Salinifilum aidingensis]
MNRPNPEEPQDFPRGDSAPPEDETATPPAGMSALGSLAVPEGENPASGADNLADVIRAEDVGSGAPSVLGAAPEPDSSGDPGEWPTLRRERSRSEDESSRSGPLGRWLRSE